VISFSRGLSADHAAKYYTRELAAPENQLSLDLETGRVQHHGAVAIHLGLASPKSHTPATFKNLCEGLSPDGTETLVAPRNGWSDSPTRADSRANARNAGWDINCSPDKSVSIAALVLGDERILAAHREAVAKALQVIEASICTRTPGGRSAAPTGALLATTFDHGVSRALDPQLHTHIFVHNITVDRSGKTRAVYIAPTFKQRDAIQAAYSDALEQSLTALGYQTTRDPKSSSVHIKHIPRQLKAHFSSRAATAREEEAALRHRFEANGSQRTPTANTLHRWAAQSSRPEKAASLSWSELRDLWLSQVRELGFEPDQLRQDLLSPQPQLDPVVAVPSPAPESPQAPPPPDATSAAPYDSPFAATDLAREKLEAAIRHFSERATVFTDPDLVGWIRTMSGQEVTTAQARAAILESPTLIAHGPGRYTTAELIAKEQRLADLTAELLRLDRSVAPQGVLESPASTAALLERLQAARTPRAQALPQLSQEQQEAVHALLTDPHSVLYLQGFPGAGKSLGLSSFRTLAEHYGAQVRFFAPTTNAVRALRDYGLDAETIQRFNLTRVRPVPQKHAVWVIDEIGQTGLDDFTTILARARAVGAKVIAVGDPAQHRSIPAGNVAHTLERIGVPTVRLTELRRQIPEQYRAIADAIVRQRDPERALSLLETWDPDAAHTERARSLAQQISRHYLEAANRDGKLARPLTATALDKILARKDQQLDLSSRLIVAHDVNARLQALAALYLSFPEAERNAVLTIIHTHDLRERFANIVRQVRSDVLHELAPSGESLTLHRFQRLGWTHQQSHELEAYTQKPKNLWLLFEEAPGGSLPIQKGDRAALLALDREHQTLRLRIERTGQEHVIPVAALPAVEVLRKTHLELHVGDRVQFREPNRSEGIANGMLATYTGHCPAPDDPTRRLAAFRLDDGGRTVYLDGAATHVIDYGYSVTSFSAQGATRPHVLVHIDTTAHGALIHSHQATVDFTRGAQTLTLVTDDRRRLASALATNITTRFATDALRHPTAAHRYLRTADATLPLSQDLTQLLARHTREWVQTDGATQAAEPALRALALANLPQPPGEALRAALHEAFGESSTPWPHELGATLLRADLQVAGVDDHVAGPLAKLAQVAAVGMHDPVLLEVAEVWNHQVRIGNLRGILAGADDLAHAALAYRGDGEISNDALRAAQNYIASLNGDPPLQHPQPAAEEIRPTPDTSTPGQPSPEAVVVTAAASSPAPAPTFGTPSLPRPQPLPDPEPTIVRATPHAETPDMSEPELSPIPSTAPEAPALAPANSTHAPRVVTEQDRVALRAAIVTDILEHRGQQDSAERRLKAARRVQPSAVHAAQPGSGNDTRRAMFREQLKAAISAELIANHRGVAVADEIAFACPNKDGHKHGDRNPSASWNQERGAWFCHGGSCKAHGGYQDLAQLIGVRIDQPLSSTSPNPGSPSPTPTRPEPTRPTVLVREGQPWEPSREPETVPIHPELGIPDHVFEIRNREGQLFCLQLRWDAGTYDDRKHFAWWRDGRFTLDKFGLSPADAPLFGSERLAGLAPGSRVVVTEGAKAANALLEQGIPAVATISGASALPGRNALRPLVGFDVVLWEDHDLNGGGEAHMRALGEALASLDQPARLYLPALPDEPEFNGYDAADWVQDMRSEGRDAQDMQAALRQQVDDATTPVLLAQHPDPRLQALLDHAGNPDRFDELAASLAREHVSADPSASTPNAIRVVVSGGRDHVPTDEQREHVIATLRALNATHLVTAGDRGVDRWAETLGRALGLEIERHLPDWETQGRRAGYLRNVKMLRDAQGLILLPGASKEEHLRRTAATSKVPTWDFGDPNTRPPAATEGPTHRAALPAGVTEALQPFALSRDRQPSAPEPDRSRAAEAAPAIAAPPTADRQTPTLILTRNPDFVTALRDRGWIGSNTQIRATVDHPDQIAGLRVVGHVPLSLAAHAHSVVDVPLPAGTPRDHHGLAAKDLEPLLTSHSSYTVRELDTLPAPPARTVVLSDQPEMLSLARELGLAGPNSDLQLRLREGEDLRGVRIVGEPPLASAATAREVVVVSLDREPGDLGQSLSLERLREIAGRVRAFEVKAVGPERAPEPVLRGAGAAAAEVAPEAPRITAPAVAAEGPAPAAEITTPPAPPPPLRELHPVEPSPVAVRPLAEAQLDLEMSQPPEPAPALPPAMVAPAPPQLDRPPIERFGELRAQDLRGVVEGRRYLIVGDVHGCLDELKAGLRRLNFDPQNDVLISVGDLADRGPHVRETIDYFRSLPRAFAVQGNHEQLLSEYIEAPRGLHSGIEATLRSYDWELPPEVGHWMGSLPHVLRLPDGYVVHAGLNPTLPIAQQRVDDILWMRDLPKHPATPEAQRQALHAALDRSQAWNSTHGLDPSTPRGAGYVAGLRAAAMSVDQHFGRGEAAGDHLLDELQTRAANLAVSVAELRDTGLAALERDAAHLEGQRLAYMDASAATRYLLADRGAPWHTAWPKDAPRLFVGHTPQPEQAWLARTGPEPESGRVINLDGGAVFGAELRFYDSASRNIYALQTPMYERSSISPDPAAPDPRPLPEGVHALTGRIERSFDVQGGSHVRESHGSGPAGEPADHATRQAAFRAELERPAHRAIDAAPGADAARPGPGDRIVVSERGGLAGAADRDSRDEPRGLAEDAPELLRVAQDRPGARVATDRGIAGDRQPEARSQGDNGRDPGDAGRNPEPRPATAASGAHGEAPLFAAAAHDHDLSDPVAGGGVGGGLGDHDRGADGPHRLGGPSGRPAELSGSALPEHDVAAARARLDQDDELLRRYGRTPDALRKLAQDRHAERSERATPAVSVEEAIDRTLVEQFKYRPVIDADALLLGTYASLESPPSLEVVAAAIDRDTRLLWSPDRTRATLPELVTEQHRIASYLSREKVEPMLPGATAEGVARDQQLPDGERRSAIFTAQVLGSPERVQVAATLGNSIAPNDAYRVLERTARGQGYDVLHLLPDRSNPRVLEDFGHPDVMRASRYLRSGVAERAREPLLVVVHGAERLEGETLRRVLDRAEIAGHRVLLRTTEPGIAPAANRNPLYLAEALGKPRIDEPGPARTGLLADWWQRPDEERTPEALRAALEGRLAIEPSAEGRMRAMTERAVASADRLPFAVFATPERAAIYTGAVRRALSDAGKLDLGAQRSVENWRELRDQPARVGDLLVEAPREQGTWAQYLVSEVEPEAGKLRVIDGNGQTHDFSSPETLAGLRHFRSEPLELAPGDAIRWSNPRSHEIRIGHVEATGGPDDPLRVRTAAGTVEPLPAWNIARNFAAPAFDRAALAANDSRDLVVELAPDRAAHPARALLASHDPHRLSLVIDSPDALERLDRPGVDPAALPLAIAAEHLRAQPGAVAGTATAWAPGQIRAPELETAPLSPGEPGEAVLRSLAASGVPQETLDRFQNDLVRQREERNEVREAIQRTLQARDPETATGPGVAVGAWYAPETGRTVRAYLQPNGDLRLRDVRPDGMEADLAKVNRWQLRSGDPSPALTVPALTPGGSLTLPTGVLSEGRAPRRDAPAIDRPAPGTGRLIATAAREAAYAAPAMALGDDSEGLRPLLNSNAAATRVAVEAVERMVQSPFLWKLRAAADAARPGAVQQALDAAETNPLRAAQAATAPARTVAGAAFAGGARAASVAVPQAAPVLTAAQVAKATAEQLLRAATRGTAGPAPGPEIERGR